VGAKRRLGRSELEVTPIGLGCWQFSGGKGLIGGYWGEVDQPTVDAIVRASLDGGIDWFDTAEAYGGGQSERSLARALETAGKKPGDVTVATKWLPIPRFAGSLRRTIDTRIACLAPFPIDLHQVHQPYSFSTKRAQMAALADLVAAKKIRAAGVSNFSAKKMRISHAALGERGVPLATNQVPYSLVNRRIESNGVMAAAKELGVTIIAYSPLGQGILTGKFHDDPRLLASRGPRRFLPTFRARGLARTRPLVDGLRAIAQAHGATATEVSLAWLLQFHGEQVVAIPGATKLDHVKGIVGAMALKLSAAELQRLDELSRPFG
jgi:aryl-alcohol dehydrogenase-like predicted oxidoreductase